MPSGFKRLSVLMQQRNEEIPFADHFVELRSAGDCSVLDPRCSSSEDLQTRSCFAIPMPYSRDKCNCREEWEGRSRAGRLGKITPANSRLLKARGHWTIRSRSEE